MTIFSSRELMVYKRKREETLLPSFPLIFKGRKKNKMKALQVFGFGTLLLLVILLALIAISATFGGVHHNSAVSLSALSAGTIYNPYFWLIVIVAYGAAFWFVKWRQG